MSWSSLYSLKNWDLERASHLLKLIPLIEKIIIGSKTWTQGQCQSHHLHGKGRERAHPLVTQPIPGEGLTWASAEVRHWAIGSVGDITTVECFLKKKLRNALKGPITCPHPTAKFSGMHLSLCRPSTPAKQSISQTLSIRAKCQAAGLWQGSLLYPWSCQQRRPWSSRMAQEVVQRAFLQPGRTAPFTKLAVCSYPRNIKPGDTLLLKRVTSCQTRDKEAESILFTIQ